MNTQWICKSCRRRLCRPQLRRVAAIRLQAATFTSIHSQDRSAPAGDARPARKQKRPSPQPPWDLVHRPDTSAEDDFLQRITAGRNPNTHGPYSGRYLARSEEQIVSKQHIQEEDATYSLGHSNNRPHSPSGTQSSAHPFGGQPPQSANLQLDVPSPPLPSKEESITDPDQSPGSLSPPHAIETSSPPLGPSHERSKRRTRPSQRLEQSHSRRQQQPFDPRIQDVIKQWLKSGQTPPSQFLESTPSLHAKATLVSAALYTLDRLCHFALPGERRTGGRRNELADRTSRDVAIEVLATWKLLFRRYGEYMAKAESGVLQHMTGSTDFTAYAESEQMRQLQSTTTPPLGQEGRKPLHTRLQTFLALSGEELMSTKTSVEKVAMLSYSLAKREASRGQGIPRGPDDAELASFAHFIQLLMHQSDMPSRQARQRLPMIGEHIDEAGIESGAHNAHIRAAKPVSSGDNQQGTHESDRGEQLVGVFGSRLRHATDTHDFAAIDDAWADIQQVCRRLNNAKIPAALFEPLIRAYMTVRRPQKAVEVWNAMTTQNTIPNLSQWDAMLRGFGACRDDEAVRQLWSNMIQAGMKPDQRSWAALIHAYSTCFKPDAAMRAFEAMAEQWRRAQIGSKRGSSRRHAHSASDPKLEVPKPNTQCLNSLVHGLARAGRQDNLGRAFAIATELEIPLDNYTFNPLFQAAYLEGDTERAALLMKKMLQLGIKPDVATFTIQLCSLFHDARDEEPKAQLEGESVIEEDQPKTRPGEKTLPRLHDQGQQAVQTIFNSMSLAGIEPTAHTYVALISGLLRQQPPKLQAAYATVRHLAVNDLPLSPQIYSRLTKLHFEQEPPDLAAVEALWQHAQRYRVARERGRHPLVLDTAFYDRFIEGWSQVGNTHRALQIYASVKGQRMRVGWRAMRELVARLLYEGNREAAQSIANDARQRERGASLQHSLSFWRVCLHGELVAEIPEEYLAST